MNGPATLTSRIEAEAQRTPQWQPWLDRVGSMLREDATRRWDAITVERPATASADAPLLADAVLRVPAALLEDRAESLAAAVAQSVGAESELVAWPLLRAAARALRISTTWTHGWCPVCGAWPTLVESRGLERARRLRCGRCAADWPLGWLVCVFCGESEHGRLRALVPKPDSGRRVDACLTCAGYVKTCATLSPFSPEDLPLEDLATVALDVVAIERGFARPAPSHAARVRVVAA